MYQASHSYDCTANIYNGITIWYYEELLRLHIVVKVRSTRQSRPERIYNSHYGNGVPAIECQQCLPLVLSSIKVNIAENPIAVMGL